MKISKTMKKYADPSSIKRIGRKIVGTFKSKDTRRLEWFLSCYEKDRPLEVVISVSDGIQIFKIWRKQDIDKAMRASRCRYD